jgi:iron complex transport system substrate-binding protein
MDLRKLLFPLFIALLALPLEGESGEALSRVVVLNGDAAEIICALGAEGKIVGVTDPILKIEELSDKLRGKPPVGRWNSPSFERIVELNPQAVIAYRRYPGPKLEEKLKPLGIGVFRLDCYKIESLNEDILKLGRMFDREGRARELIRFYGERLKLIRRKLEEVPSQRRVRVYVESYTDYTSVSKGSGGHQLCVAAGGMNIAESLPVPYPKVSSEWVLERNPQVIVKAVTRSKVPIGYGVTDVAPLERVREEIMNRPGWSEMEAVKKGRVYLISADIWTGPRAFVGICYMARWFYPELFGDIDPEEMHRDYLRRFLGVEYRGRFVLE